MKKIITIVGLFLGTLTFAFGTVGSLYAYTTADGVTNDMNQYSPPKSNTNCVAMTNTSLKLGARDGGQSRDVASLQTVLIEKGYMKGQITGFFGKTTVSGVKEFQKSKGIPSSGVAGPTTLAKIRAEVCPQVKQDVQGSGDGTEINPLNTYTPPKKSTPVCNSEQYLKDGKCQSFTFTCPNGKILSGYPKGDACGVGIGSVKLNGATCSYAAPPVGCSYVAGSNFNSQTNCGLVLSCSSQSEDVLKREGVTESKKIRCPLMKATMCPNGGVTTMDPVTCQITYCDGTKSPIKKEIEVKVGPVSGIPPEDPLYYCNGVISHNPCNEVFDSNPTKAVSCPMTTDVMCSDGSAPVRDPRTCAIISCGASEKVTLPSGQDTKARALLEAKRLDELTKKAYITDSQRVLLMNQKNEVLMNAGVSQ